MRNWTRENAAIQSCLLHASTCLAELLQGREDHGDIVGWTGGGRAVGHAEGGDDTPQLLEHYHTELSEAVSHRLQHRATGGLELGGGST
jgi:hypothetical protein